MIEQDLAALSSLLSVNGKSLVEFTADNMRRLSLSYQLKNNPKFHQLLTEVLQKIEETAKSCQFKLCLTVPNNSDGLNGTGPDVNRYTFGISVS